MPNVNKNVPPKLYALIDAEGRVFQTSGDKSHIPFMSKYTRQANTAGEGWMLVEYRLNNILVSGEDSPSNVTEIQGG